MQKCYEYVSALAGKTKPGEACLLSYPGCIALGLENRLLDRNVKLEDNKNIKNRLQLFKKSDCSISGLT